MSIKTYNNIDFDLTKIIENFARKGGVPTDFINQKYGDVGKNMNIQRQVDANINPNRVQRRFTAYSDTKIGQFELDKKRFNDYQYIIKKGTKNGKFSPEEAIKGIDENLKTLRNKLPTLTNSTNTQKRIQELEGLKKK